MRLFCGGGWIESRKDIIEWHDRKLPETCCRKNKSKKNRKAKSQETVKKTGKQHLKNILGILDLRVHGKSPEILFLFVFVFLVLLFFVLPGFFLVFF